jgi:gamma-glutamylaminecyclotransferase
VAGEYTTQATFTLYLVGERNSPWLIQSEKNKDHARQVLGQLFTLDDAGLAAMDTLERIHEVNGYQREIITIVSQTTSQTSSAYVYLKKISQIKKSASSIVPFNHYRLEDATLYISRSSKKSPW